MQWLKDFAAQAQQKLKQYNNSNFKNAVMAVCALVAAADGSVDKEEKSKVATFISKNELLSVFNGSELKAIFLEFCDKASDEFSRIDLLNLVRKLKGDDSQADTVLRVAIIVANSDGNFDEKEKAVIAELCSILGFSSSAYVA